ncbi:2'-deoxynucleoside 5'-phosphate N-hydrolase 1 [Oopsacas minuta]|uniref:Putative 2'-deoxynucleoside 5'-phosphate N-hydrolase 1 n=1 Tax=Oopsacas minuta TaxID=111878 RepID=A0AAV7KD38_9METZ|nr:2'-deoxynucleoside 5'-phosphate N-hydrolase 1 [Oopsacas minuta]
MATGSGLNIYFAGSIAAGRQDADVYAKLVEILKGYGTVLTEHVGSANVEELEKGLTNKGIHDRDIDWLVKTDVFIAEVTQPSLGVGYEIGRCVAMGKRVLCLFRPESGKRLSSMIRGADNGERFKVVDYELSRAEEILKGYLSEFKKEF